MNHRKEVSFPSSDGIHTLYATVWTPPEGDIRAVVQICHGMVEHMERYEWLAGELTARGFLVCGDDHLGHGRSAVQEDELGYFGAKDGWRCLIEDEHRLRLLMQKEYPSLPYFLLGHSMGSFITRNYVAEYAEGLAGYLCCGTAGRNPLMSLALLLSNLMVLIGRGKKKGRLINRLAFRGYNSRYGKVVTGNEWLSRDDSSYLAFENDPKCHFLFTNAGFRDLFTLLNRVSGKHWSDRVPKNLPFILLAGDMDPVGCYGKGVRQVYGWLKSSGVRELTLKLYPGARHELHNETNRDEFVEDIVAWMNAQREKSGS
ncbi:MAG: alpha/beta hydrolase [Clostridiales bacterium]|nr:alpha/beta hydrolase [Clostridiales bacterium]